MSDLFEQVTGDQDIFKKIASIIPGFGGYVERANRRTADKLLRDTIADQYEQLWKRVGNLQKDLISSGDLTYVDDLETAATKLQTFINKIRHASYGYAGFFDAIKIREEELAKIYQYDLSLLEMKDEISRAIDNVEQSLGSDGLPAAVRHLIGLTRDLVSTYESRDEAITAAA